MNIQPVLEQRGAIYGNYGTGVDLRSALLKAMFKEYRRNHNDREMPEREKQYFFDIVNKLIRLAVSPTHRDSWVDIIGYSTLIVQEIDNAN